MVARNGLAGVAGGSESLWLRSRAFLFLFSLSFGSLGEAKGGTGLAAAAAATMKRGMSQTSRCGQGHSERGNVRFLEHCRPPACVQDDPVRGSRHLSVTYCSIGLY